MEPELEDVTLQSYKGERDSHGRCHGTGFAIFRTGAMYDGAWASGKMHGVGTLTFPDGIIYTGGFVNNTITGNGKYEWPSGATYMGQMAAGKRHGHGRMSFTDSPATYDGAWVEGMRQGQGTLTFNIEKTASYTGEWHHDTKHGSGTMQYPNGDVYEGEWRDDLKCGRGTMTWTSLKQQYSGEWVDNKPNGVGTHVWFQQATAPDVAPASNKTHAMLLMYNRYQGHFKHGRRDGYGALYYATGARYEGEWVADQKHGEGCFVFENGSVWAGGFVEDRPTVDASGATFGSQPTAGVIISVPDLLEEEETPAASIRAINNVLMCYNSELRALYDKYSKRASANLPRTTARPSFTLVAAQLWDLLADARLMTPHTSLAAVGRLMVLARKPPPALDAFRQQMKGIVSLPDNAADAALWAALDAESTGPLGAHSATNELLFREFCELVLRIAALRYQSVPGLERRLHTLINVHLLPLIGKAKAGVAVPPKSAFQTEFLANDAVQALSDLQPTMRRVYSAIKAGGDSSAVVQDDQAADAIVSSQPTSPRAVLQLLQRVGAISGPHLTLQSAAHALCFNFLAANSYEAIQRLRIDTEAVANDAAPASDQQSKGGGAGGTGGTGAAELGGLSEDVAEGDPSLEDATELEMEVLSWLDASVTYPEVVEGLARCAYLAHPSLERLGQRLAAFWTGPTGLVTLLGA